METGIRKINKESVLKRCRERTTGYKGRWMKFIHDSGTCQGGYFATLTFKYPPTKEKMNCYLNLLLHFLNQRFYGRKYAAKNLFLHGFAFFEKQYSGSPHVHLLLFYDENFYIKNKPSFENHFFREAQKVKYINRKGEPIGQIFFKEGLDVRQIYSAPHLISYLLKTMKKDDDFIGVIRKEGITWGK